MTVAMEMVERKDPKFISFGAGETVAGVLLRIEKIEIEDDATHQKKAASRFVVEEGAPEGTNGFNSSGELVSFLGTADLVNKLRPSDIGHFVTVVFEREDKSITRNGNAMKRFTVKVSKNRVITDSDIGF